MEKKRRPLYFKGATEFKVEAETRKVSGYLAAFGNIDSDRDMLMPGCFLKSINDRGPASKTARKIAYLNQHDMEEPIGVFTMLKEDDKGLYFEATVDDTEVGNEALVRYASGSYNQHSIGYCYVWDKCRFEEMVNPETNEPMQVFLVFEVKLFEGSVVTMGANENTPFTGFKSEAIEDVEHNLNKEFDALLQTLPAEKQYEVRRMLTKYLALAETEPIESLKEKAKPLDYQKVIKAIHENLTHK